MNYPDRECNMFQAPSSLEGKFEYRGDEPLSFADKNICLSPELYLKYRDWVKQLIELAQTRCE